MYYAGQLLSDTWNSPHTTHFIRYLELLILYYINYYSYHLYGQTPGQLKRRVLYIRGIVVDLSFQLMGWLESVNTPRPKVKYVIEKTVLDMQRSLSQKELTFKIQSDFVNISQRFLQEEKNRVRRYKQEILKAIDFRELVFTLDVQQMYRFKTGRLKNCPTYRMAVAKAVEVNNEAAEVEKDLIKHQRLVDN